MSDIKFNKCQTPIGELKIKNEDGTYSYLEDLPKEIQEQFFDFLNNVPFIKWLVSPDRPLVSELPRDDEGKAIIDVTRPPILENTDFFRPMAKTFQNQSCFTKLKPNANPNSEYGKWLLEERRRAWDGLIDPSTGMWVTGDMYWMLNYCPMHLVKKGKNGITLRTVDFPAFWDGQFLVTHYIQQARWNGKHGSELASRGKGKTSLGGALLSKRFILGETSENQSEVQCLVTAADRTKLIGTNQILNVFIDDIDFCAKHAPFDNKRLQSSVQELSWQAGYKRSGSDVKYGSKNSVMGIISGVNQDKLNGSRGVLYIIEEAGIFKDLLSMINLIRPSVEQGTSVFGQLFLYGTAGDSQSNFQDFQEIIYSPNGYNMQPLPNVYDKEGQGRQQITVFYPAYLNKDDGCMDENGNSNVTKALFELLVDRYKIKYGSTDINTITKRISQYPITPQEAILQTNNTMFPVSDLNERLNQLDNNPSEYDDVYIGELVQRDGKIEFNPTGDIPIRDFPTKDNKLQGALEIFAMPQKDPKGNVFPERYIIGLDPIDNDQANTMSFGSMFVLDLWTDTIAAEYTGRPPFANDLYELVRKTCMFYNAKCMYENNLHGIFSYFSQHNCTYLLADTPEYLKERDLIKTIGTGNTSKGVRAGTSVIKYAFKLIRDWLMKPVTKIEHDAEGNEIETSMPNLYRLRNRALIKEMIVWNPNINVDRIMSLAQLMLYREEKMVLYHGDLQGGRNKTFSSGLEEDPYFTSNYRFIGTNKPPKWMHAPEQTIDWSMQ